MTLASFLKQGWGGLPRARKTQLVVGALVTVLCLVAALRYAASSDGLSLIDPADPGRTYVAVFVLIVLDAVIPIFPGETTLNAASTAAAQGLLDLMPIILAGFLGAVVGDSALFWIARRYATRIRPQLARAKANPRVRRALATMDSSAPVLIVGGRYVPGLRFVVNATMGLSDMPYRRFLPWSVLSGLLWSVYTCVLAHSLGLALVGFPLASVVISGVVTTAIIAVVFVVVRRGQRAVTDMPVETADRRVRTARPRGTSDDADG